MKANELRIGNLVYDVEDGNYYEIESIYLNYSNVYWVSYRDGSINCRVDALEPVVLTEEWLLKFGFEKKKDYYNRYYFSIDGMDIKIDDDMFETEVGECLYKTIKYVHQLQNLYFALNDEELTMK